MRPEDFASNASGKVRRQSTGYFAFIPDPLPPRLSWSDEVVSAVSGSMLAIGELAGVGHALPNPYLLVTPFVRREAVLSSRIEGTQATLTELYLFEAAQLPPREYKPESDVREVYNYVRALEYGLDRLSELPVSLRLIRELHRLLMDGTRGQERTPGEFRRTQNWIGPPGSTLANAAFVPPPVPEMIKALGDLEEYLHAPSNVPGLVRLALIHYQFEAIHPFLDGNGRVGRLLITLLLSAWGILPQPLLYLSAYFEKYRRDYYDLLLAVSHSGSWESWLLFFLRGVEMQSRDSIRRMKRLFSLQDDFRRRIARHTRAPGRLYDLVDLLFEQPVVTLNYVTQRLDVSYATASRYMAFLESEELVREMTGFARNRVFGADLILSGIEAPMTEEDDDAVRAF